jgi:hypothetical protein
VDGNIEASYTGDSTTSVRTSHDGTTGLIASANFGTGYTDLDIEGKDVYIKRGIFGSIDAIKVEGSSGDISFYDNTGVTQGFFWDASAQRLGLGTTAVSDIFTVKGSGVNQILTSLQAGGTSSECRIELIGTNSTSGVSQQVHIGAYQPSGGANTDAALDFRVRKDGDSFDSPTTIMTLTDGNVGIGTSSPASALHVVKNSTTLRLHRTGGTSGFFELASFRNNAGDGAVGSIVRVNDASVQYNTSSDYRLKTSVVYDWDATTRLKQLKPARFEWISDGEDAVPVDGFLAHEAQAVVPECVSGTKDEVDDDGNPVYQGIDQSKLVPLLVKTIQELEARITALEAN